MPQNANYWKNRSITDHERDWINTGGDWVEDYWLSKDHPHREFLMEILDDLEFRSLLEVGCNAGPNLSLIQERFPKIHLMGIDVNRDSVELARKNLKDVDIFEGDFMKIPANDKSFDVVLSDAVLLYADDKQIGKVIKELDRVARKAVVLVERFSEKSENNGYVWSHNYPKLLEDFDVTSYKLDDKWPSSKGWQERGYVFVARPR